MNPEVSGGSAPEIDPNEIIEQKYGPDYGRIKDVEIAQVGAETEKQEREKKREPWDPSGVEHFDLTAGREMAAAVADRAGELAPEHTLKSTKEKIQQEAARSFSENLAEKRREKQKADEDLAQSIRNKLRGTSE